MEDEERQKKLEAGKAKVCFPVFSVSITQKYSYHENKVVLKGCQELAVVHCCCQLFLVHPPSLHSPS